MLLQIELCVVTALPDALVPNREPAAGLVDELQLHGKIYEFSPLGNALAVHDIEDGLFKRRRDLVFDDLGARAVADDLGAVLDGLGPANIDTNGRVELERVAARGRLGVSVHDADLHTKLVDEDDDAVRFRDVAGKLSQRLRHQPRLKSDEGIAHLALNFRARRQGRNIYVVQQSRAYVVERLGAFSNVWTVGIHFKVPFVERVAKKVSLKEQVLDYPPQPVITKDNVTMQIDTVVYFQITDPKLYAYGVEHPMMAMETLTATTLRNIIGDLELDQTLTSRDVINTRMRAILDEATDPWGIKVNRVELKNILPPQDIQNSMEKQMKAERDRRQAILQAEGAKHSQILVAEGEKEAAILKADAEKQAAILKAEAEKESAILRADGEAQAIRAVQQALADSLAMLNEKAPNDQVLKLKALEAMQKVADGKATKIIIPSELQGLAGLATGITEAVKEAK